MCVRFIVKYLMFFVNFLFALIGIALIIVGILSFMNLNSLPAALNFISIGIIIFGSVVFLIAFCGCCGAITESICLLVVFSVVMAVIAACKIYVAVVLFGAVNNVNEIVGDFLHDLFIDEPNAFHIMEFAFHCCGTNSSESYNNNTLFEQYLPPTCCGISLDELNIEDIEDIDIENIDIAHYGCVREDAFDGCVEKVSDYFDKFGRIMAYVFIGIVGVEVIAMFSGLYLCCSISNKKKYNNYYY
ncbi:leukocyte surface antigen CD53-like [Aphomia sociella]